MSGAFLKIDYYETRPNTSKALAGANNGHPPNV